MAIKLKLQARTVTMARASLADLAFASPGFSAMNLQVNPAANGCPSVDEPLAANA